MSSSEVATVKNVIWSEVLTHINFDRENSSANALRQVVLRFFSPGDITDGKRLMVQECNMADGVSQFLVKRNNSSARQAHEAELDSMRLMLLRRSMVVYSWRPKLIIYQSLVQRKQTSVLWIGKLGWTLLFRVLLRRSSRCLPLAQLKMMEFCRSLCIPCH